MTEEEIIRRGHTARALMAFAPFTEIFEIVKTDISLEVLSHSSDEIDQRRKLLALFDAMRDFTHRVAAYAQIAEELMDRRAHPRDSSEDDDTE